MLEEEPEREAEPEAARELEPAGREVEEVMAAPPTPPAPPARVLVPIMAMLVWEPITVMCQRGLRWRVGGL